MIASSQQVIINGDKISEFYTHFNFLDARSLHWGLTFFKAFTKKKSTLSQLLVCRRGPSWLHWLPSKNYVFGMTCAASTVTKMIIVIDIFGGG